MSGGAKTEEAFRQVLLLPFPSFPLRQFFPPLFPFSSFLSLYVSYAIVLGEGELWWVKKTKRRGADRINDLPRSVLLLPFPPPPPPPPPSPPLERPFFFFFFPSILSYCLIPGSPPHDRRDNKISPGDWRARAVRILSPLPSPPLFSSSSGTLFFLPPPVSPLFLASRRDRCGRSRRS